MARVFDNQPDTIYPITAPTRRKLAVALEDTEAANELVDAIDSSRSVEISQVSLHHTALAIDDVILCDATNGPVVVTLFPATEANSGKVLEIKKIDPTGNIVTVDGNGANIDGGPTAVLTIQFETITIVTAASAWWIL
ncbi:hypothetical protein LCGC14_0499140 [marine sediment metagenome]|uniref:Uncharacterized protein n=1 Tax=marine sediment metagenome TaxID=412755 RepID=A0A0F9S4A0_9ZZZZ